MDVNVSKLALRGNYRCIYFGWFDNLKPFPTYNKSAAKDCNNCIENPFYGKFQLLKKIVVNIVTKEEIAHEGQFFLMA